MTATLVINNVKLYAKNDLDCQHHCAVHICEGSIAAITPALPEPISPAPSKRRTIDAKGATLIPGLHDHHIHLASYARSLSSVCCGAPAIETKQQLIDQLRGYAKQHSRLWLRGYGFHPGIAGDIDRDWLDRHIPENPVRIQHRSGRLWILNSMALQELGLLDPDSAVTKNTAGSTKKIPPKPIPAGAELKQGRYTGRLFEEDAWLGRQLAQQLPDFTQASQQLASFGVTSVTDCSPENAVTEFNAFREAQQNGALQQSVRMMGSLKLTGCVDMPDLQVGELKLHLLESMLPDFNDICQQVQASREQGRHLAFHCVSRTELVFALAVLSECGSQSGDRLEHAGVVPPELMQQIAELDLTVVTQHHFLYEQGDRYLAEVALEDQPYLYLGKGFLNANIPLAAGSDAPFGSADPWAAMYAAVTRQSRNEICMQKQDRLTPEQALDLFICSPQYPGRQYRQIAVGGSADLCLLDAPWRLARRDLNSRHCRLTIRRGRIIHEKAQQ